MRGVWHGNVNEEQDGSWLNLLTMPHLGWQGTTRTRQGLPSVIPAQQVIHRVEQKLALRGLGPSKGHRLRTLGCRCAWHAWRAA